jgi:hypothetical protein
MIARCSGDLNQLRNNPILIHSFSIQEFKEKARLRRLEKVNFEKCSSCSLHLTRIHSNTCFLLSKDKKLLKLRLDQQVIWRKVGELCFIISQT